jgi:hypothetical protein
MSRRNKEGRPLAYRGACSRCGADAIYTDKSDTLLCLICRAALLALNFQARGTYSLPKKHRHRGWLRMMVAAFGKPA